MNRHIKTFILIVMLLTGCNSKSADSKETSENAKSVPPTIQKTEVFIREYSEEHLKNNPSQKIQSIVLLITHWRFSNEKEDEYSHFIDIFVKGIGSPNWYQKEAGCAKNDKTNKYECESDGDAEFGTFAINDLNEVILSPVNTRLFDKCTTASSTLNIKTINLNDAKGKPETFKLYLSDEANFKKILKGSNCVAPFRD